MANFSFYIHLVVRTSCEEFDSIVRTNLKFSIEVQFLCSFRQIVCVIWIHHCLRVWPATTKSVLGGITDKQLYQTSIKQADSEINQWKKVVKDGKKGGTYVIWNEEDWNNAAKLDDETERILYQMATVLYVGAEKFEHLVSDEVDMYRWQAHHSKILTGIDLHIAAEINMNKRLVVSYIDVEDVLNDSELFLLSEGILIRRLRVLGGKLLNNALGASIPKLVTNFDTSQWNAVAFKLIDAAVSKPVNGIQYTSQHQIKSMQSQIQRWQLLKNDGFKVFLKEIVSAANACQTFFNMPNIMFDGFSRSQMAYYAEILIGVLSSSHLKEWLKKIITYDEGDMICSVHRPPLVPAPPNELLIQKIHSRIEKNGGIAAIEATAKQEVAKWEVM